MLIMTTQVWARKPTKVEYECHEIRDYSVYGSQSGNIIEGGTRGYQVIMKTKNGESLLEGGAIVNHDDCLRIISETKAIWNEIN